MNLNEQIFRVGQHVLRARVHFDIWWLYAGPSRDQHIDAMNDFSEFYRFDQHAHLVSYVIYAYGIFEKRTDTLNLHNIAKQSKRNAAIDHLLAASDLISPKIKLLRHKAFAHRDNMIPYDDVFKSANVTPNELRAITETAIKTVNLLNSDNSSSEIVFHDIASHDAEAILKILRDRNSS